jgi:xanthosine utilization system XapX-like protein
MKYLLRYLELVLTAVGVIVVALIFSLYRTASPWKPAAVCAVVVGVLHGIIFYMVRAAQRRVRNKNVFSIRTMLEDMMQNQLSVALYPAQECDDWHTRAQKAVWEIQARLNFIEAESLKRDER